MKRSDFRFFHHLRVRWAEVDRQGVVFNPHYLMYFSTAITDYWRTIGLPYDETMARLGAEIFVKKATVEYKAPARMDEELDIAIRGSQFGTSSMVFTGCVFRGEEALVTYEMLYVFADTGTKKSRPVPEKFRAVVEAYDAGKAMDEVYAAVRALVDDAQTASSARK